MNVVYIHKPQPFSATFTPPGSKSLTNRVLLLAALAGGRFCLRRFLESEDTKLMQTALRRLGVACQHDPEQATLHIQSQGGLPTKLQDAHLPIDVGTAGTVARFLTASLAASSLPVYVDGSPRMRERPMKSLIDALCQQGAHIRYQDKDGYLPIYIHSQTPLRGGDIVLQQVESSQFVSAVIFASLFAQKPTRVILPQGTPARPYVDMTLACVRQLGGQCQWIAADTIEVVPWQIQAKTQEQIYEIEPDASSASYFFALAAIYRSQASVPCLGTGSLQGDTAFPHILAKMGAHVEQTATSTTVAGTGKLMGGQFDLSDMPDMTLTLAVTALHATGRTEIWGVEVLRHHESDRLAAAANELRKLGAQVEEYENGLVIDPPASGPRANVEIHTYLDHRMAMAFSLAGDVGICDPGCVNKTFPSYFDELARLGMVSQTRP